MVVHPQIVMKGHLGGCAAAKQGKFVEYRHEWWDKAFAPYAAARDPSKLGEDTILAIARDLKLDEAKFKADMASPECQAHVQADMDELGKWHVGGTPSFFLDGKSFQWSGQPDAFKTAIDDELKKVESSGVPCADYYQKKVMDEGEKTFKAKGKSG
jgi:predicted DsbA family dithiol-disulfide isomerase